ncbi:hypothetical protein EXE43_18675 [Halorubrum sp. SS5]|nr:hypothetical protein EXE43_18675 [Halorubrum sp. SS5]
MTANAPIPLDAFATELESLDGDAFADLVAEAYAATADEVEVDGARVTVTEGGRRIELLAVAAADGAVPDAPADAVVVASDSLLDDLDAGFDADVVTPADLRERLLYGVPPATANAVSDRFLDVPIRSAAYESAVPADAPDPGTASADDEAGAVTDDGDESGAGVPGAAAPEPTGDDDGSGPRSTDRTASGSSGDSRADARPTDEATATDTGHAAAATDMSDEGTATDGASERTDRRALLAAVGVAVLLVAAAGAGFAAGAAGVGGPDGLAGVGGDGASDPAAGDSNPTGAANESDDGSGGSTGDDGSDALSVADGDPTGEAARNTAPSPTCERSALQVVQIQMNALRYNDNATNDGIRTLRAFASPQNRDLVGSTEEYAELFETPLYGPMLTYDTAQYSVPDVVDDAAYVEVVTRENGSVTGRYEFRLVRVAGGSGDTDTSLGDVDDCWMTDAVAASTE